MAGNSAWNQAVKQAFKMGRSGNKNYSLKDAMMDAKKIYRKGKNSVVGKTMKKHRRSGKKSGYGRRRTRGGNSTTIPKGIGGYKNNQNQQDQQNQQQNKQDQQQNKQDQQDQE